MRIVNFSFFFLALFLYSTISAQDKAILVRQSGEQGFTCLDENGALLFTLPPGHEPTVRESNEPFKLGDFYIIDLSQNILPVTDDHRYYLIDGKGKEIRDMGTNINWISALEEGFFRVFKRFENRRNASVIVFYDRKGNPLFEGREFWEASRFRDGRAVVQLEGGQGNWWLMNTEGEMVMNLSDTIPGNIRRITKFENGTWELSVKNEKNYYIKYYLRPDGALSNKASDLWLYQKNGRPYPRKPGPEPDVTMQKRLNSMEGWVFPPTYKSDSCLYLLLNDAPQGQKTPIPVIYNHKNEVVHLDTLPGIKSVTPLDIRGQYLITLKITEQHDSSFVFYNLPDLVPGYETKDLSYKSVVEGDFLVDYSKKGAFGLNTATQVVNLKTGKVIYRPDMSSKIFKSLTEALKYKEEVKNLELVNVSQSDITQLEKFSNLEILKIKDVTADGLPEGLLAAFPGLHALRIENFPSLTYLPTDLPKLRMLYIEDCPNLRNMEDLMQKLPALREVRTDHNIGWEKIKILQEQRPELIFQPVLKAVSDD